MHTKQANEPIQVWHLECLACKLHALQVVSATNIIGAGHGLEVGKKLELLGIRQAEAHAERAERLKTSHFNEMRRSTAAQGLPPQTVLTTQVCPDFQTFICLNCKPICSCCVTLWNEESCVMSLMTVAHLSVWLDID